jgi:hypothetical protein
MSNTLFYRSLLEGTLSALWPGSFPQFGNGALNGRLGDVLNQSRIYMAQQWAGANPLTGIYSNTVNHIRLYHLIGDPTLQPWLGNPFRLLVNISLIPLPDYIDIHYGEDGTLITVQQQLADGSVRPIARGMVQNGAARLNYVMPLGAGSLLVTGSKPNAVTTPLNVQ